MIRQKKSGLIFRMEPDENGNINCINCMYCTDCVNCTDCVGCVNCTSCVDCTYCINSVNCYDCDYYTNCVNCIDGRDCVDCSDCLNVFYDYNLQNVKYIYDLPYEIYEVNKNINYGFYGIVSGSYFTNLSFTSNNLPANCSLNSSTGIITGNISELGTYNFTVNMISDQLSTSQEITIYIGDTGRNLNCSNCTDCYNCINCENCSGCMNCVDCINCQGCLLSSNCIDCNNNFNIINCNYSTNLYRCNDCSSCNNCLLCYNCTNIKSSNFCKYVNGIKNEYTNLPYDIVDCEYCNLQYGDYGFYGLKGSPNNYITSDNISNAINNIYGLHKVNIGETISIKPNFKYAFWGYNYYFNFSSDDLPADLSLNKYTGEITGIYNSNIRINNYNIKLYYGDTNKYTLPLTIKRNSIKYNVYLSSNIFNYTK